MSTPNAIHIINLIHDFVGFILILIGSLKLKNVSKYMGYLLIPSIIMIPITAYIWFVEMLFLPIYANPLTQLLAIMTVILAGTYQSGGLLLLVFGALIGMIVIFIIFMVQFYRTSTFSHNMSNREEFRLITKRRSRSNFRISIRQCPASQRGQQNILAHPIRITKTKKKDTTETLCLS